MDPGDHEGRGMSAAVPAGYKQTDVGVIPEDWIVKNIGDVCQIFGRIGFRGYTVNRLLKYLPTGPRPPALKRYRSIPIH